MAAYAYICKACSHLSSNHTLAEGGDLHAGPYHCAHCDCAIAQEHDCVGLSRREYEAYEARLDTPPNIWRDLIASR